MKRSSLARYGSGKEQRLARDFIQQKGRPPTHEEFTALKAKAMIPRTKAQRRRERNAPPPLVATGN